MAYRKDRNIVQQSLYMKCKDTPTYAKLYGTKSAGLQEAVNSFLYIRQYTIRELKGRFTSGEITALADIFRGNPYKWPATTPINVDMLITVVVDTQDYQDLEVGYGVDYKDLIWKLKQLTAAQCFFLYSEISRYWKLNKGVRRNIDGFVDTLT